MGFFEKIKNGLKKTREGFGNLLSGVFSGRTKVDENMLEELLDVLIMSDLGGEISEEVIEQLREVIREKKISEPEEVRLELKEILKGMLNCDCPPLELDTKPSVILVIGVNGVGKTTSIGKLAYNYVSEGKKVLLAAADTFRAAAAEQLSIWADRSGAQIVRHAEGADPAAVVFDACAAGKARGADVIICDTAGRLHNKANLMNELAKINKVIDRELTDAHKEVFLVIDATTGQNALIQAREFAKTAGVSGIVLTKLDGTAKGGVVIAVSRQLGIPVRYIGVGEQKDDLMPFDPDSFIDALFERN
ncbi:MAG: signal recognition particle-docking protein FtsY [Clostridia bacterium]|nr:signal recognition particle-docking protein FtsY [Clostridia bacterium]